ncbi:nucleolar and coiled-body phosphoprotein 1 isoform X2 [Tanacetum coccineum]
MKFVQALLALGKVNISEALVPEVMILLENVRRKWFIGALPLETSAKNHVSDDSQLDQPAYIGLGTYLHTTSRSFIMKVIRHFVGKCVATEPDTSSCNLHDRSARRSRAQVKRGRDGASGASTATKCSLVLKRPCGILTDLLTSGGLEFGKYYSLPTLSGPRIDVGYGAKAEEVLGQVRGRDFRHEKTKKKRGSYGGGQIDLQSHSIKFDYFDEVMISKRSLRS